MRVLTGSGQAATIADEQLQTLGFEGQQVSWETAHRWQFELNAKLVSATPDVLRQIKTPEEVEKIRLACGIADRGAEHIRRFIQAGMSEREIAAELEWFMRQQGAEKASFDTIVASGWRGALPPQGSLRAAECWKMCSLARF